MELKPQHVRVTCVHSPCPHAGLFVAHSVPAHLHIRSSLILPSPTATPQSLMLAHTSTSRVLPSLPLYTCSAVRHQEQPNVPQALAVSRPEPAGSVRRFYHHRPQSPADHRQLRRRLHTPIPDQEPRMVRRAAVRAERDRGGGGLDRLPVSCARALPMAGSLTPPPPAPLAASSDAHTRRKCLVSHVSILLVDIRLTHPPFHSSCFTLVLLDCALLALFSPIP